MLLRRFPLLLLKVSLHDIVAAQNENMLSALVLAWSFHKTAFNMMKDILMYMDRAYCQPRKKATVYTLALQLFRETVVRDATVNQRMKEQLLNEILKERHGQVIDRSLLKSVLSMLVELGIDGEAVYEVEFEALFLDVTRQFYKVESLQFLSENTCPDYMLKAETRLAEEAARVQHYVPMFTEGKLRTVTEQELIAVHSKTLLEMENSGVVCMMRDNKLGDLQRLYGLYARIPSCLEQLRDAMADHVKESGLAIVAATQQQHQQSSSSSSSSSSQSPPQQQKDPVGFVRAVLELKEKFDIIISRCFRGEQRAKKKLQDAFEEFVNRDHQCAAYLAAYIDDLLRGGIQGVAEAEVEEKLERVIVIFKFLADKDIFENFYKNLLSKRLLSGKSVSDEVEKTMISKLKAECGYQYTSKLEGMFMDMNVSKSVQESFRASERYASAGIEMEVHVLTTGYWPLLPSVPCELPPQLFHCSKIFTSFYLDKNSGRRLAWLTHLGSVDVKVLSSTAFASTALAAVALGYCVH